MFAGKGADRWLVTSYEFVASALRIFGAETTASPVLLRLLARMGGRAERGDSVQRERLFKMRPSIAIAEPAAGEDRAIDLDGFYALHPALASLKPLYDQGRLAIEWKV